MANQITVRGLDERTEKFLRDMSKRLHISLNKTVILLIKKAAGISEDDSKTEVVGESLDSFIGSWSANDEADFLNSIRDMEIIDEELWQ